MKPLKQSKVIYTEDPHGYTLDGLPLSGITKVIGKHVFPNKYAGAPEFRLNPAKAHGTNVHKDCEQGDISGEYHTTEGRNYALLMQEYHIDILQGEYLVSDDLSYATMIDKIDTRYNLYDIKTTSELDKDYLSWQLSFCAYLFEIQNEIKAGNLYAIWLRGEKAELIPIERLDNRHIEYLIKCDLYGEPFINPIDKNALISVDNTTVTRLIEFEEFIVKAEKHLENLKEERNNLLIAIEEQMTANDIKKWETEQLIVTRVLPSVSQTFDSKAFKEEMPETYEMYLKETHRKGYIKLKIKATN